MDTATGTARTADMNTIPLAKDVSMRRLTVGSDAVTKGSAGPIVTPPHITDN